jgi:hypothetical protein
MSATSPWKIPAGTTDWECDWRGDLLFHLRLFRSFSLAEKIQAVEEMTQVAAYFRKTENRDKPY